MLRLSIIYKRYRLLKEIEIHRLPLPTPKQAFEIFLNRMARSKNIFLKKSTSFVAHDEKNECNEGDTVKIMETRPLSKSKNWRLVEILEKAK